MGGGGHCEGHPQIACVNDKYAESISGQPGENEKWHRALLMEKVRRWVVVKLFFILIWKHFPTQSVSNRQGSSAWSRKKQKIPHQWISPLHWQPDNWIELSLFLTASGKCANARWSMEIVGQSRPGGTHLTLNELYSVTRCWECRNSPLTKSRSDAHQLNRTLF